MYAHPSKSDKVNLQTLYPKTVCDIEESSPPLILPQMRSQKKS